MSKTYQGDVYTQDDQFLDTLEVGGDDGSLPPTEMGPATAAEELQQLAEDDYGSEAYVKNVRIKGATG